jgi:hypothetical protein
MAKDEQDIVIRWAVYCPTVFPPPKFTRYVTLSLPLVAVSS